MAVPVLGAIRTIRTIAALWLAWIQVSVMEISVRSDDPQSVEGEKEAAEASLAAQSLHQKSVRFT